MVSLNENPLKMIQMSEKLLQFLIAALSFSADYYCARIFYNSKNLNCIGALCFFFLRCVHTFFNDFDLSKRDKQVKPSGH